AIRDPDEPAEIGSSSPADNTDRNLTMELRRIHRSTLHGTSEGVNFVSFSLYHRFYHRVARVIRWRIFATLALSKPPASVLLESLQHTGNQHPSPPDERTHRIPQGLGKVDPLLAVARIC